MSDKPAADSAASSGHGSSTVAGNNASSSSAAASAPKKPINEGNPAFRAMGLPRFRVPSRNWLIFLSITGGFASAVTYDKYQTRQIREKWCRLVSHVANEQLDIRQLPRRMTVYLAAPPGDGLRNAREHFHDYIKPVLVAGAMDWEVIEGRKEGDVRFKTAERIRKKRRRGGEGEQEESQPGPTVEDIRSQHGIKDWEGVGGDLVVGRHTWKEYIRGLHEGWLGPVDPPRVIDTEGPQGSDPKEHTSGQPSVGDSAVNGAAKLLSQKSDSGLTSNDEAVDTPESDTTATTEETKTKEEEEKPKPRHPPSYILPADYATASPSSQISDIVGPSTGIRFPHILGFRNTPIRVYRFLTRRHLADQIGRDVAAAVLASHRAYSSASTTADVSTDSPSEQTSAAEQAQVLAHEERDWWKTTYRAREPHEESVWIEPIFLDERIAGRMRAFALTAEDEDRARRIARGEETKKPGDE